LKTLIILTNYGTQMVVSCRFNSYSQQISNVFVRVRLQSLITAKLVGRV